MVTFFSAIGSTMVLSFFPIFMINSLHFSPKQIGWVEGCMVLSTYVSKCCAGVLTDIIRRRKTLIVAGTALSIMSKSLFIVVSGFGSLLLASCFDRWAKGLRTCPTDAMIGDLEGQKSSRAGFFAKHAAMLTGSTCGALITTFCLKKATVPEQILLPLAVLPCLFAFATAQWGLREGPSPRREAQSWAWTDLHVRKLFTFRFCRLLGLFFLISLGRFGMTFACRKALECGIPADHWPLASLSYDLVTAFTALVCGWRVQRIRTFVWEAQLLRAGLLIQSCAHLLFFLATGPVCIYTAITLSGVHMGMTYGIMLSMVAAASKPANRGTALAIAYITMGLGIFCSNQIAGWLCEWSTRAPFAFGAVLCLGVIVLYRSPKQNLLRRLRTGSRPLS